MSTLQKIAAEMVDDEIECFKDDGMTVTLTAEQIVQLKQDVLNALCDAFNEERDFLNDYIRAHARTEDQEREANNA
jgi:hypothetical protein